MPYCYGYTEKYSNNYIFKVVQNLGWSQANWGPRTQKNNVFLFFCTFISGKYTTITLTKIANFKNLCRVKNARKLGEFRHLKKGLALFALNTFIINIFFLFLRVH